MDLDQIQMMLHGMGERMIKLAKLLEKGTWDSKEGKLDEIDNDLIRYASMPSIRETIDLLLTAHLVGNHKWKEDNFKRLNSLLEL